MAMQAQKELRPDGKLRLPPGQRLTTGWPVLHYGSIPKLDTATWKFHVWGLVEEEKNYNWEQFNALGQTTDVSDIHCVTTWSKYDNEWAGVPFKALYDDLKVKPEAKYVMVHSYGGYTTNVPLEDLLQPGVLFAHSHDGKPLAKEHGWPMRLVVPHLYFWKSAKWVGGIQFLDSNRPGFWETYGYHIYGDPWREERYS
jgi:DMSO/TMAO reductase YedYZ molybdopterin-dependent catalytic subunit